MAGWWAARVRRFVRYWTAGVSLRERDELATWLTPAQLALFDSMHQADQRHGLDVVAALRAEGHRDRGLLLAGLLHDASKGPATGVGPRIAWSLGERYGHAVWRLAGALPGYGVALGRLRDHPAQSAELALAAGCPPATADLIRHQADPVDPVAGRALLLADEAS
jgi:hypothetical protein